MAQLPWALQIGDQLLASYPIPICPLYGIIAASEITSPIAFHELCRDLANPLERLGGSVERVTFHSEASGFCVLRVKVRGQRDLSTVIGSAASVIAGEYVECFGNWINDRSHGLRQGFPTQGRATLHP